MIAVILAGGTGTRLWPYSRVMTPKQFLNLGSTHESLFQETCRRIDSIVSAENIFVVGSDQHENELKHQISQILPNFCDENLLIEPQSRNTAPAILWAIIQINKRRSKEPVVILASDHLIKNPKRFIEALKNAEELANSGYIVTFGICPEHPETGYGYIKAGDTIYKGFRVDEFVEKPDQNTAEYYFKSSKYFWNASIFMATTETWLNEFNNLVPELYSAFVNEKVNRVDLNESETIKGIYQSIKSESVDYALLEKSKKVAVLPVEIEWSDLGSWESIFQISEKDSFQNAIRGNVITLNTNNSLIFSNKKLVTSIGVENLIIVETDDALLVCDMKRSQDVKKLVETLKKEDRHEYKSHNQILRPWGLVTTIIENTNYKIRLLEIMPQKKLSLQRHMYRNEHWVVLKGKASIKRGEDDFLLNENESTFIHKGIKHRLSNQEDTTLKIIEVQYGEYIGENDIERFT